MHTARRRRPPHLPFTTMPPVASAPDGPGESNVPPIRLGDDITTAPAAYEQPTTGPQISDGNTGAGGQFDLSIFTDYLNDKITALLPDGVDLHGVDPTVLLSVLLLCVFIVLGACVNRCSGVNLALRWCRFHAPNPAHHASLIRCIHQRGGLTISPIPCVWQLHWRLSGLCKRATVGAASRTLAQAPVGPLVQSAPRCPHLG